MKLKQILTNKKIVIVVLVILVALIVGIAILVTLNSKETGGKDNNTKTEQSKEDTVTNAEDKMDVNKESDASEQNNSAGLEVLQPDEVILENSSNASGSWDGSANSNQQTDEEDNGEEQKKDEDILEDDINWGRIY